MPKAFKVRGRREAQKKRKHVDDGAEDMSAKRMRGVSADGAEREFGGMGEEGDDFIEFGTGDRNGTSTDIETHGQSLQQQQQDDNDGERHYGLLEPEEQEYYTNVNNKIVSNDFESEDDRALFIEAVYRESRGKELKLASSQSSSRHLEKIMPLSTPQQLGELFQAFLWDLEYLIQHRFGSHCCEALFLQAAKYVHGNTTEKERNGKKKKKEKVRSAEVESQDDTSKQLEQHFLAAVEKIESNVGYLLTDKFASHVIRVLILVLSGESLDETTSKAVHATKKHLLGDQTNPVHGELLQNERSVPITFQDALERLVNGAIAKLDTTSMRALATHPQGNPVLQLLLRLELRASKKEKLTGDTLVFQKLFPDDLDSDETESAKFITSLVYDSTGSRLVEILVQDLPGKVFKKLYNNVLKSRMASMARNDVASYVAAKVLERLGKDDISAMMVVMAPHIRQLIERRRTVIVRTFIERCTVRGVQLDPFANALVSEFGEDYNALMVQILNLNVTKKTETGEGSLDEMCKSVDMHSSLLAQAMSQSPATAAMVRKGLLTLTKEQFQALARNQMTSRVLQTYFTASTDSFGYRKQTIPFVYGCVSELAQDPAGSYLVDSLWAATSDLHFMKERIAQELIQNETQIRESFYGRNVWKNWQLDLYRRRHAEWTALAKRPVGGEEASIEDQRSEEKPEPSRGKTAIQLARERFSARKKERASQGPGGRNATDRPQAGSAVVSANA